jgi:hypothetical protein
MSGAGTRAGLLGASVFVVALAAGPAAADGEFRTKPDLRYENGDHTLVLSLENRSRIESWDAHADDTDSFYGFYGVRTRVGLHYSFQEWLAAFAQFQDARIYSLGTDASGAGAAYRANTSSGRGSRTHGDDLRQFWLELRPLDGLSMRAGRQDIKLGTQAPLPEKNWQYLKTKRAAQRLVGTVGWTHAERGNEGASVAYQADGHHVYAFAARPTTGVFDLDGAYRAQEDITYGGVSWTVERGSWLPNTEIRLFGLGYEDERSERHGGRPDDARVWTLGGSAIGIYPLGPGRADFLLWGAYQFGDFTPPGGTKALNHSAAAGVIEAGYQLHEAWGKPWLRVGVNAASGDGDPDDSRHETFFNLLPTNHLYYGFADQLAFQNLIDWFAQLIVQPCQRVTVNLMLHQFSLDDDDDQQYFGTGAFNRSSFGYGSRPSRGHSGVATELDAVVDVSLGPHASVQAGYAQMWGRGVWSNLEDEDVSFGYLQVLLRY